MKNVGIVRKQKSAELSRKRVEYDYGREVIGKEKKEGKRWNKTLGKSKKKTDKLVHCFFLKYHSGHLEDRKEVECVRCLVVTVVNTS